MGIKTALLLAAVIGAAHTQVEVQAQATPSVPAAATLLGANPPAVYLGHYLGCFADRKQRDLTGPRSHQITPQACISFCAEQELPFASMQRGNLCSCGDSYGRYGPSNACRPCPHLPGENCGGKWANAVWELSGRTTRLPLQPTLLPPGKARPGASAPAN